MIAIYLLILGLIVTRFLEWRSFMKNISKLCERYDKKYIFEKNRMPELIAKLREPDSYFIHNEWSAYHFLFLKGPSPYDILFSLKSYRLENFYHPSALDRLRAAGII